MTGTGQGEPVVSVVIPAYNAEQFVATAVDSVLDQSYSDLEIIVVNDGSTDGTASVLAGYGANIRVINKENGGLSAARNSGIEAARGEWVAFLDADDRWLPEKLARQMELVRKFPEVGFCSTVAVLVDENGEVIRRWGCPGCEKDLLRGIFEHNAAIPGSGSGVVVRKHLFAEVGGFDVTLNSLEDVDMWIRLASVTAYRCVPEPLTIVLRRMGSMSASVVRMRHQALTVMRKNRRLLDPAAQGSFWRSAYAGVLADYSKWEYRAGRRGRAIWHLVQGLIMSPLGRGRMIVGLLWATIRREPL